MKNIREIVKRWYLRRSILSKFLSAFILVILTASILNVSINRELGAVLNRMDSVYESNEKIAKIQTSLSDVQESLYSYLNGNYDSLKTYYVAKDTLTELVGELNSQIVDSDAGILETNIRNMCWTYLYLADCAVQGHRGTDLESYSANYEEAEEIYSYLGAALFQLNSENFEVNSKRYEILAQIQRYTQNINIGILIMMSVIEILIILLVTTELFRPLENLVERTELVGGGELELPPLEIQSYDEIGQVTQAFNTMTVRLNETMRSRSEEILEQSRLKERQLVLETHLKDSQLGALQAQINPHFLYNTLNAGEQLALMEDAEQTCLFLEHVADYYRYNIRRSGKDVYLREELEQVENYLFIMNTRFGGEIGFEKNLPDTIPEVRLPGMILQPIMENAIEHGLKNLEEEKKLALTLRVEEERIVLIVADNGPGFPKEEADRLLAVEPEIQIPTEAGKHGIGMKNVLNRLRLYFDRDDVLEIGTGADGTGCEVRILIPYEREEHLEVF